MSFDQMWDAIPEKDRRYKCHTCHHFFDESSLSGTGKRCPKCGEIFKHLEKMCCLDHNHCQHETMGKIDYCPICKLPICPECGTHDVLQISRVTGYLQDVSGWNNAKRQELKDRVRYSDQGVVASVGKWRGLTGLTLT